MNDASSEESGTLYRFRPRLVGSEVSCRLGDHSIEFLAGSKHLRASYPMIERVRLSFRPNNLSMNRYVTEIWTRDSMRLEFASVSLLPNLEARSHAPEYRSFVQELHRKIVDARGDCEFVAGFPAWRWWPLAIIAVLATGAEAVLLFYVLTSGQFLGALIVAALGGLFLWQVGAMVLRNRPRIYAPDSIPEDVLPSK